MLRRRGPVILLAAAVVVALWALTAGPDEPGRLWRAYHVAIVGLNLVLTYVVATVTYFLVGPGNTRIRAMRVIAMTAVLGLLGVVVEFPAVVLKLDYGKWIGSPPTSIRAQLERKVNRFDSELVHIHWPHTSYRGTVVGNLVRLGIPNPKPYDVDLRYDHNGFRNDADLERADVVAIGDSFLEASLTPLDQTVVKQLERRLGRTVANLGQSGYGVQQESIVLERYGFPLQPEVVLWFFFGGNDLRDVRRYDATRELLDRGLPLRRPYFQRLLSINALLALAHYTTPPRRELSPAALSRSAWVTHADRTKERVYFGQTNGPWNSYQWETATAILKRADENSRAIGATFVVVFVPRKFRVYRDLLEAEPGTLIAGWDTNRLPEALGDWCQEQGIAYIDTTPHLQRSVAAGEHPYMIDDLHWNARGQEIAADLIASHLQANSEPAP